MKPCPFCGNSEKVMTYEAEIPNKSGFRCGCATPECDINPYTRTIWATKEDAIESWNRRKDDKIK